MDAAFKALKPEKEESEERMARYSKKAQQKVGEVMKGFKQGKLRSGARVLPGNAALTWGMVYTILAIKSRVFIKSS